MERLEKWKISVEYQRPKDTNEIRNLLMEVKSSLKLQKALQSTPTIPKKV